MWKIKSMKADQETRRAPRWEIALLSGGSHPSQISSPTRRALYPTTSVGGLAGLSPCVQSKVLHVALTRDQLQLEPG